jgi:ribonucleoside-diphosphate reductase alpha chain
MQVQQVKKRDGSLTELDIDKIRKVINWACEDLRVNAIELESAVSIRFYDGIETRAIQENLVDTAQSLVYQDGNLNPDWTIVAGRLYLYNLNKDVEMYYSKVNVGNSVYDRIEHLVKIGIYDPAVLDVIEAIGKDRVDFIWNNIKAYKKDDENGYDIAGARLWRLRYLCATSRGEIVETPTMALFVLSVLLACEVPPDSDDRIYAIKMFFDVLSRRKLSLATPILRNLRRKNGSLTSCFITQISDSKDSIFYVLDEIASMSKHGGGVGVEVSRIRAVHSEVNGIPSVSGGVAPWLKLINDTAVAVNQGGARAGAVTAAIRMWHLDLPEFLELQTENGDMRRKCFDIFPQLGVPDLFMQRVSQGKDWTLVCPYEFEKHYSFSLVDVWGDDFNLAYLKLEADIEAGLYTGRHLKIDARETLGEIVEKQLETGLPYLAFIDEINRKNPNKDSGMIHCVNLCVESFSNISPTKVSPLSLKRCDGSDIVTAEHVAGLVHCCNLVSINMANIEDDAELAYVTKLGAILLDTTIDLTAPPVPEASLHNQLYRTIGIGIMGWADYLAKRKVRYDSVDAVKEAGRIAEIVAYNALSASVSMAKTKAPFEMYDSSEFKKGIYLGKTFAQLAEDGQLGEAWLRLGERVALHGVRNSHLTAIAPNTSSSIMQHCTASILPVWAKMFMDSAGKQTVPVCPPFVADAFWYYRENKTVDQQWVIDMSAEMQKWIDTGISMELLFNLNDGEVDVPYIMQKVYSAWKSKCKAIYYIRSVQKGKNGEEEICISCAN